MSGLMEIWSRYKGDIMEKFPLINAVTQLSTFVLGHAISIGYDSENP